MARVTRWGKRLSLTGIIVTLSVGVLVPVLLSSAVGIVTLALGQESNPIVVGVLIVSFTVTALGSVVAATVLLGKRARTARLQADLLANVSHDLRTPLAAIRMYAQTLQGGQLHDDPQRAQECLDTIVRQTQWLDSMIDRLLTWRAAAKDRANLRLRSQAPGPTVEEAVRRFLGMLAPGEVALALRVDSQTPVAHDVEALGTIVLNLLINAYRYSGQEKKIDVSIEDRRRQVAIIVADNGLGIPPRELRRIFEPFYRVSTQLASKSSGAGLGLAIVRHLVKAHGGEVQVESEPGRGSRFTVLLPAAKAGSTEA